jgi:tetratricopeptide (TPR) repeat protein
VEETKNTPKLDSFALTFSILVITVVLISVSLSFRFSQTLPPNNLTPTIQTLVQAGSLEEAAELWENVLAKDPNDQLAHYQLGLIYAIIHPDEAVDHLNQAATLDQTLTDPVIKLKNALRRGAFDEDPAYRLVLVGQTLADLGEWYLARAAFERGTQENPNYTEAWAYLGEAQYQTGEDSLEALEKAIALNPSSLAANAFLGLYWHRNSRPELALVYLQTAANLDPDNPAIQEDIAKVLANLGNFTAAMAHLIRVTELLPMESGSWQTLARFSLDYDVQVEEVGLPAARQAVLLAGDDPVAITLLGRAHMLLGNDIYPIRFFTQALEIDPTYPDAHLYLGIFYLEHGEPENAQTHLETALQLDGDGPIGRLAQQVLERYFP